MIKTLLLTCAIVCATMLCYAQPGTSKGIHRQQQALQKQLDSLNANLAEIRKATKTSAAQLALSEKKIAVRQQMINDLNREVGSIDIDINTSAHEVIRLQTQLAKLRQDYAASIAFTYKSRSNIDYLNFLFSASSFNDAVKRVVYLGNYRRDRERIVAGIDKTSGELTQKVAKLSASKTGKTDALHQQAVLLTKLGEEKKEQAIIVQGLKAHEREITAQLKQNEKNSIALRKALKLIIEREQKNAAAAKQQTQTATVANEKKNKGDNKPAGMKDKELASGKATGKAYTSLPSTQQDVTESVHFESRRGRLPWPAATGVVSIHFGLYHIGPTSYDNEGITIALPAGATVKAVADGEVSAVFDLGGESVVIIRHGKYRTAYSNLATTSVSKGDKITTGKQLGTAATNLAGEGQLQFDISTDKSVFVDPEKWLMPR